MQIAKYLMICLYGSVLKLHEILIPSCRRKNM